MDIILIAAVTADGKIAHHADEIITWSEDLSLFKKQTMDQTVIMGSKTAESLSTSFEGRTSIVIQRDMDPVGVLKKIDSEKCFIIGGSITYGRFAKYLTHLYLTYHPFIFSSGSLPLFTDLEYDLNLKLIQLFEVEGKKNIYQFQYKVIKTNEQEIL
ncbi:MAG: dihydrofolate reductase [Nitrospinota bacterium]|nr:dihydrofolate reductase [Nitrospinota bacterium]|tara:strand:+ start:26696 stop:27166 length:471 start_codon:yes stop_codon:yes gene_type:complete